jgi:hypothetical protein
MSASCGTRLTKAEILAEGKSASDIPHVRWARWQAKQARLAFFLLGLRGSFGFGLVCPLEGFCWSDEPEALLSVFAAGVPSFRDSAMFSVSSWSPLNSGSGDTSSALGDMISLSLGSPGYRSRAAAATLQPHSPTPRTQ